MSAALELGVDALATFRLTRLLTKDRITRPLRDEVIAEAYKAAGHPLDPRRKPGDAEALVLSGDSDIDPPAAAAFIVCPWCVGMYVAAGVALARRYVPGWEHLARLLALSAATGLLAGQE